MPKSNCKKTAQYFQNAFGGLNPWRWATCLEVHVHKGYLLRMKTNQQNELPRQAIPRLQGFIRSLGTLVVDADRGARWDLGC